MPVMKRDLEGLGVDVRADYLLLICSQAMHINFFLQTREREDFLYTVYVEGIKI